jgi:hypothetical protein
MSWTARDVLALGSLALAGAALGPSRVGAQAPKRGGTPQHPRLGPAAVRPDAHHSVPRARAAELDA